MRAARIPLTLQRMGEHRLVLAAVLLTILISAALAAALAVFAGQAVPQAVHRRLALAADTPVLVSGPVTENQETAAVRAAMRSAFGTVPFAFYGAVWSDSLDLPAPADATHIPLMKAAAPDAAAAHSVLVTGAWPTAPAPGQPIPAALPSATASLLRLSAGDVLTLRDRGSGRPVSVRLTGTFRPRDPASAYWQLNLIGNGGYSSNGQFTTYGPLVVSPAAFRGALAVGSASWVAEPDVSDIPDGDLSTLAGQVTQEQQLMLDSATLGGLKVTTNLPTLLDDTSSNLVVAHSLLLIGGLQLLLLAVTALTLAVRLLASQRQVESALLSARGGARWQLARLNAAEAMPLAAVAVGGGVLAGGQLAGVLARTGPLRAAGLQTSAAAAAWAWLAAVLMTLLCVAIMLGSGLRPLTPGTAWTRRGRQASVSGLVQAGGDVALLLLAVVAVWELRRYSAVAPSANGTFGVDPVLAVAPVLALAAGTVVLVRLLPIVARAGDRLALRGRRLAAALAVWQISRRPIHHAGAALLVVLAVATGTFALSQHQSWVRSVRDQAAFTAGADVRVDTPLPVSAAQAGAIATAPGVRDAMPVAQLGYGNTGQALAVDAARAPSTVLLRPDLSALPATALFRRITPGGQPAGLALPGRPDRLEVTASLGPASLRLAPVTVALSVQDADGNVYSLPAGTLSPDGRPHALVADITPAAAAAGAPAGEAVYPLRLLAVTLAYSLPRTSASGPALLTVHGIAVSAAASGPFDAPFASGAALAGWTPDVSSADLAGLLQNPGSTTGRSRLPTTASWRSAAGAQTLSFNPGYGQASAGLIPGLITLTAGLPRAAAIPGIATQAYLGSANVSVGSTVPITVTGVSVPVKIVAAVTAFPTVSGSGGAVIVDLAAVQDALAAKSLPPAPVSEWWLSTGLVARVPAGLDARLPAGSAITVPGQLAASLLGDPLSAAPQQALLAIAAAAAILAIAGFSVAIAASGAERRPQSALLSALGVSPAALARQLALEELMLSVPSAAIGVALGTALAWLLVPAVTLTTAAVAPVPAPLPSFAWSWAVLLAAAVAVLPVLVAAATVLRRPDPAALLRTTEAA